MFILSIRSLGYLKLLVYIHQFLQSVVQMRDSRINISLTYLSVEINQNIENPLSCLRGLVLISNKDDNHPYG